MCSLWSVFLFGSDIIFGAFQFLYCIFELMIIECPLDTIESEARKLFHLMRKSENIKRHLKNRCLEYIKRPCYYTIQQVKLDQVMRRSDIIMVYFLEIPTSRHIRTLSVVDHCCLEEVPLIRIGILKTIKMLVWIRDGIWK